MKIKFLLFSLFVVIAVAFLGCIESEKLSSVNFTTITTPEPVFSPTGEKSPSYNKTIPLIINIPFDTWSRGYASNLSYEQPYFRIITNYKEWNEFLDNQGYFAYIRGEEGMRLEGELFPGIGKMPKTIKSTDFNKHFILAAMMGLRGHLEDEIEIIDIRKISNTVNVTIRMYQPSFGAAVESAPYHIIIVSKEQIPEDNITFNFIDIENGRLLARIAKGDYRSFPPVIETISSEHPVLINNTGLKEVEENYYSGDFRQECIGRCKGDGLYLYLSGYPKLWTGKEVITISLQNAFTGSERLEKIEIMPEKGETVAFKSVAVGDWSGYINQAFMIINNRTEWVNVWQKHSSYLKAQKPSLPEIDFTNETVVAVFSGESPAYDTGLINITKAERNIFVNLQKKFPASRSSVQPYFIVRMSKTNEDIVFRTLKWEYRYN